jgi:hypothetical protein
MRNLVITYDHATGETVEHELTADEQNAQPTETPPLPESNILAPVVVDDEAP